MPAHRHCATLFALGLALALSLSGCGGKDDKKPSDKPSSSRSSSAGGEPAPDPGYGAPKVGQCHKLTAAQSFASVDTSKKVKCSEVHTSVVAYVGYLPKPVTPATPVAQRRALGKKFCQPAYQRTVGGTLADRATSILTWTLFTPDQSQLEHGARWVRCDVVARSGTRLVPLLPSPMLAAGVPEAVRICQNDAGIDVSCSQPHAFRVEAVFRVAGNTYPNTTAYTKVARARCKQLVGSYGGFWQPPSQEGWAAGDRFIRCLSTKPAPSVSPSP